MKAGGKDAGANGSGESVVGGIAEFGNDVATLFELQAKLVSLDLKDCLAKVTTPMLFAVTGMALALASLPVILFGVAFLLAALLKINQGWAMLLTGVVVLVASAVIALTSLSRVRLGFEAFRRSREELVRNLSWLRTVLVHSGRSKSPRRF